jgi:hypothetical protein
MYNENIDDIIKYYAEGGEVSSTSPAMHQQYLWDKYFAPNFLALEKQFTEKENALKNQIDQTLQKGRQDTAAYLKGLAQSETNAILNSPDYKGYLDTLKAAIPKMEAAPFAPDFRIPGINDAFPISNQTDKEISISRVRRNIEERENQAKKEALQGLLNRYDVPIPAAFYKDINNPENFQSVVSSIVSAAEPVELENRVAPTLRNLFAQQERLDQEKADVMSAYNDTANVELRALRNAAVDYTRQLQNDYDSRLSQLESSYIKKYGDDFSDPAIYKQFRDDVVAVKKELNDKINTLYSPEFDLRQPDFEAFRQSNLVTQLADLEARRAVEREQAAAIAQLTPEQRRQQASGLSTTPFPTMSDMQPLLPPTTGLTPQQAQDLINQTITNFSQATGRPADQVAADNQEAINAALEIARKTDLTPKAEAPISTGGQPFPYQPLSTPLPKAQADALATEFFAYSGVKDINDASGKRIENPAQYLSNLIQQYGPTSVRQYFEGQGLNFTSGMAPKLAPELADKVAREVGKAAIPNYDPQKDPNFGNNKLLFQNYGLEEGLKLFAEANKADVNNLKNALQPLGTSKPTVIYDSDGVPIETSRAMDIYADIQAQSNKLMEAYPGARAKDFQSTIDEILAGGQTRAPIPKGITAEEAVRQSFASAGIDPYKEAGAFNSWVDYFTNVGIEPGIALLNERLSVARPGGEISLYGEPEVFNFGASSGAGTTPTYRPPAATQPTYTSPAYTPPGTYTPPTGSPTSPYAPPGAAPAPYQSAPLITSAERPSLDAAIQYIESTRPGAGPMPYMTSEQVGGTPVAPTNYADLFGYTPYTEYMGRSEYTTPMTANLYAAGYEANVPPEATMREGGSVADARGLAAMGRDGDTMLVHMAPEEVAGLRALAMREGTDLTINPETGLPEAKKLKRLFKKVILPAAAAYFGAPYLGGIGNAAMLYGAATAATTGSFEKGLQAGLTAYGGATAAQGMFGASPFAPTAPGGTPTTVTTAPSGPSVSTDFGAVPASGFSGDPALAASNQAALQAATLTPTPAAPPVPTGTATAPTGATPAPTGAPPGKFEQITGMSPSTALIGGTMLAGLSEGQEERKVAEEELARQREEIERRKRLGLESFERANQPVNTRALYGAGGGLVALARGGMTYMEAGGTTGAMGEPRMVAGNGDGMSDSVPATIEGVQEARLANDEFVIPADVVADIGNGSSSAGAKKLYDMMDRIREARHGTTEQPPEISAEQYMPA